jgi:DNA-directed RNA polymerase subunit M/transcription elongation factor TFIIS
MNCLNCNTLMIEYEKIKDGNSHIEWVCVKCEARVGE